MRWPFRRRDRARGAEPARIAPESTPSPRRRHWVRVPPLTMSVSLRPPVLVSIRRLPDIAGTRALLHPVRRRPRGQAVRSMGQVAGLATVRTIVEPEDEPVVWESSRRLPEAVPVVEPAGSEDVEHLQPLMAAPVRHVPVVGRPGSPRELLRAVEDYVGEAQAPESAFRSVTEIERLIADTGDVDLSSPLGIMALLGGTSSVAAPPPSRSDEPAAPVTRDRTLTRRTLGQSRRMGMRGKPSDSPVEPGFPVEHSFPVEPGSAAEPSSAVVLGDRPAPAPAPRLPSVLVSHVEPAEAGPPSDPEGPLPRTAAKMVPRPGTPERREPPFTPATVHGRPPKLGVGAPLPANSIHVAPPARSSGTSAHAGLPRAKDADQGHVEQHEPAKDPPPREPGGLVYRAAVTTGAVGTSPATKEPAAAVWHESVDVTVPSDVASVFRSVLGVEVAHVPVHRGRAVSHRAHALAARAFTERGEVFLPDEAGPIEDTGTRALLAHELVHAVQQRELGPGLPNEESAAGRQLEETAVLTERWFRGESGPPAELVHRPRPDFTTVDETRRLATEIATEILTVADYPPTGVTQRAEPATQTPPPPPPPNVSAGSGQATSWSLESGFTREPAPASPPAPAVPPLHQATVATADRPDGVDALKRLAQLDAEVAELRDRGDSAPDLDDPQTLDGLAGKLYGFIRGRLRAELIVDRERTGRLAGSR